jgi:hypothetical protein
MDKRTSPVNIIAVEEDANLREVSWNQRFLDRVKEEHSLRHCQAVLFVNVAQDRFRLVVNFYSMACLLLPPIDPANKLSVYLEVSRYLRKFNSYKKVLDLIDGQIENAKTRIERRQKQARKAKKKRKK